MTVPHSLDTLCDAVVDTVAANELRSCYIRPLIARTGEQMGFNTKGVPIETFVICWKWGSYLGEEGMRDGVDVRISSWRRAAGSTFPTMAKAGGNYLNSQLSLMEARLDDYVEGIMLDTAGHVAEGSGENLFAIRDGVMYTAPFSAGVLHGITRDSVLTLARDAGYEVREMVMPREFLYIADEVFFTGTAAEITPVRSIDRISIGNGARGPMTKVIQERYLGIAKGELPDTYSWLTPVPVAANRTR
jgi:branched-chain amino acid aminotransferase